MPRRFFAPLLVDTENDRLDFLIGLEHVRRLGDALRPGKFGDMHQSLHARLQFDKRAVRHQIDDLAFDLRADLVFGVDIFPRIGQLLLEAQADAFLFLVDVEHHHVDVLPNFQNFRRMPDAPPAHVGNMEQTVDAVEVNEGAEVGDILDRAFADVARGHFGQQFGTLVVALLLDQLAAQRERCSWRSWLILTTLNSYVLRPKIGPNSSAARCRSARQAGTPPRQC